MRVFVAALVIFAIAMAAMALGVIFSNRRLRGTCGGLAGLADKDDGTRCDACLIPSENCTGIDEKNPLSNIPADSPADEHSDLERAVESRL